jgi:hypothetical protein
LPIHASRGLLPQYYHNQRYADCLALLEANLAFKKFVTTEKKEQALQRIEELSTRKIVLKGVLEAALQVLDVLEMGDETSLKKNLETHLNMK